ncbi:MAG: hypothetical protein IJM50_06675 [Lachnospiraceae bacterium]|nr:hypothetical protein [Lachnospiraceae bacterium]
MDGQEEQSGRKSIFAYLAVLLAGLLCVGAVWRFVPDKRSDMPPVPTRPERESTSSAAPSSGPTEEEQSTREPSSEEPVIPSGSSEEDTSSMASIPATDEPVPTLPPVMVETYVEGEVVDSFYQYVNDYDWQDLYTLMILIGQTGIGLNEGSVGKHASFSIFTMNPEFDPMIFVGFTDPATNVSVMTLYITDHGYCYELLKVFNDRIYINPDEGAICTQNGNAVYRYSPHVLKKLPKTSGQVPGGFVPLQITDATGIKISRQDVESYLIRYGKGGQ